MKQDVWYVFLLVAVVSLLEPVFGSRGDLSYVFQKCYGKCVKQNCTGPAAIKLFSEQQPVYEILLKWSCSDECKYTCMWITVDAFQRDGMDIPQFYGKWPFVRFLGIQEPAAMVFSVLNALAQLAILKYRRLVPPTTPMYYVWHGSALMALNAWTWSTIFHSKDTVFTEQIMVMNDSKGELPTTITQIWQMDYFCAFSLVLSSTFSLACRVLGTEDWRKILAVGVACVVFYAKHIHFLAFVHFEYGYNMKVNIGVAIFNMLGWLSWCFWKRKECHYVWKCVTSIFGVQLLLSLELGDFPPLLWMLDAHALWHAGTAPLSLLWYSFIIDDGLYLKSKTKSVILPQTRSKQD